MQPFLTKTTIVQRYLLKPPLNVFSPQKKLLYMPRKNKGDWKF